MIHDWRNDCANFTLISAKSFEALPTPWGTQMWAQTENNGRIKSQGMFPGLQHFKGVEGHARTPRWD
jgi:hypothetical protein